MSPRRLIRLLLLTLPMFVGLAAGVDHQPSPAVASADIPVISAPRGSLPPPVHDEATCAFCQAAAFPPCTPQPADVSVGESGVVRRERPAPDTRAPHVAARRPASSRAPPAIRFV